MLWLIPSHYAHVRIGSDAAAYQHFIAEYYDCLPKHMAFINAQQTDMDTSKVTDNTTMHAFALLCIASKQLSSTTCTVIALAITVNGGAVWEF